MRSNNDATAYALAAICVLTLVVSAMLYILVAVFAYFGLKALIPFGVIVAAAFLQEWKSKTKRYTLPSSIDRPEDIEIPDIDLQNTRPKSYRRDTTLSPSVRRRISNTRKNPY